MKITFAFIIILLITLSGCEKGSQLENIIVSGKITNPKNDSGKKLTLSLIISL